MAKKKEIRWEQRFSSCHEAIVGVYYPLLMGFAEKMLPLSESEPTLF